MTHASTRSRRDVLLRIALAGLLGAALMPGPVAAQIPSVPRRVRETAARAAGTDSQTVRCDTVRFDTVVVELSAAQVDRVIKAMRASRDVLEGRPRGPGWNAMLTQRDAAASAADDLLNRKRDEMNAYHDRRRDVETCRNEAFSEKRNARRDANMQRAMSDPDYMQRMALLSQQLLEAQQRGDTAAVNRLGRESQALMEGLTREDSLAVDRQCGRLPPPPASVVQLDSLEALRDTLNARMRRREEQADSAAVSASGMTTRQFGMARERAEMFLAKSASASATICGYSATELTALKARRADLDELL